MIYSDVGKVSLVNCLLATSNQLNQLNIKAIKDEYISNQIEAMIKVF